MDNNWIKILEEWRNQKMGYNGCTLPFLVGSQTLKEPPAEPTAGDVKVILNYIFSNTDSKEKYWIRICPKRSWTIIQKIKLSNPYELDDDEERTTWYGKLLLIDNEIITKYGASKPELIGGLADESNEKISKQEYSLAKDGSWGDYTPDEKTFLNKILSN